MKLDINSGIAQINGHELRIRPVKLQHKIWENTERFFKQVETGFVQRYNDVNGTEKTRLPITFVYALSRGGHRVKTHILLEMLGYDRQHFDPKDPDYKMLLKETFVQQTASDRDECYVASFRTDRESAISVINFVVLPCDDFFVGLVSIELEDSDCGKF